MSTLKQSLLDRPNFFSDSGEKPCKGYRENSSGSAGFQEKLQKDNPKGSLGYEGGPSAIGSPDG